MLKSPMASELTKVVAKVFPESWLTVKKNPLVPCPNFLNPVHRMYTLLPAALTVYGPLKGSFPDTFTAEPNVAPLSWLALRNSLGILWVVSCQNVYTFEPATAISRFLTGFGPGLTSITGPQVPDVPDEAE